MEKKQTKLLQRILGGLLAFILLSQVFTPNVNAAEAKRLTSGPWTYYTDGSILWYDGSDTNVVIPTKLGKTKITKLRDNVFSQNEKIISVTIPSTITELPFGTFDLCSSLTTVKLPKTLKKIDEAAFRGCFALKNIDLPDGLQYIGDGAFNSCTSLTHVNLTKNLTHLGGAAFRASGLTSLTLPDNFTTIPAFLLADTPITSFTIPKKVIAIEDNAFYRCTKLKELVISSKITEISITAFTECPSLTIYGTHGSIAQEVCMFNDINFVETDVKNTTDAPAVSSDPIVMPAAKASATVTATPSKTKLAYKNEVQKVEAYTISGEDYYRATDLFIVMKGSRNEFNPWFDEQLNAVNLKDGSAYSSKLKPIISKNYGKNAKATRTYPTILYGNTDISGMIRAYSINGDYFYNFEDIMDAINCGAFLNKKTGVVNIDPTYEFEPFDSPVFSPVPKGNALYMKIQKSLYDAYMNHETYPPSQDLNVPDNTTFYIPRGVDFCPGNNDKVFLGINSKFIVKGNWTPEYPGSCVLSQKGDKKALYLYDHNTIQYNPTQNETGKAVNTLERAGGDTHQYPWATEFTSAKISYDYIADGVQHIILSVTRGEYDPDRYIYVYFNVEGGQSYGVQYSNVKYAVDLTTQLAKVVGMNVGKKAVINKIMIRNSNGETHTNPVTIPVNWTISTSGTAPTIQNTVTYTGPSVSYDNGGRLQFSGLTQNSYIVKYSGANEIRTLFNSASSYPSKIVDSYSTISPSNKYSFSKSGDYNYTGAWFETGRIIGTSAIVAQYTGVKTSGGKNSYSFVVSPYSNITNFTFPDENYPVSGSLTFDNARTYLNFALNKGDTPSKLTSKEVMVKYHIKGDPADVLHVLYSDNTAVDKTKLTGQIELTSQLTELFHSKGAVNIDGLAIFTYVTRFIDQWNIPSEKFFVVSCDLTATATESVKLGKDTDVSTLPPLVAVTAPAANTTIKTLISFKNMTSMAIGKIMISPAGKNKWSTIYDDCLMEYDTSDSFDFSYKQESPKYDIKITDVWDYDTFLMYENIDFTGITAKYGASIRLSTDDFSFTNLKAEVRNSIPFVTIKKGDFGTDTIDVKLIAGSTVNTFDVKDFSLVYDDGNITHSPYPESLAKIQSLSQTTAGNAKLTIVNYFDPTNQEEREYHQPVILLYKGQTVGIITISNR